MGIYKQIRELWQSKEFKPILSNYMIQWRKEPVVVRLERPTRLDRARSLGYKAKQGFLVARIRISRGGRRREQIKAGRRSKNIRRRKMVGRSYQVIAEERVNKKFHNCEVLNSYFLAKDGLYYWYEVVLVDPEAVKSYKGFEWLNTKKNRRRVFHGKTSAGKRSRGILTHKGKGAEKLRPSLRAHSRKSK